MSCLCDIRGHYLMPNNKIYLPYLLIIILSLLIFPFTKYLVNLLIGTLYSIIIENNEKARKLTTNAYDVEK